MRAGGPARQIAENSATDGGVAIARMLGRRGNFGFDAARKKYVDLVEPGLVDPTKAETRSDAGAGPGDMRFAY
jgi:chaperonin GroEL (HSP60 family)